MTSVDDNVLLMTVTGPEAGQSALDALRQAHADGSVRLHEAAVITRGEDGVLDFPDAVDNTGNARAFTIGGLIGGLLGILGGPLGILIGFGAGGLVGGAHDAKRATASTAALEMLAEEIPPGSTVLMAEIGEYGTDTVDRTLASYGTPTRYPAEQVRKDVEEAIEQGAKRA
ncbi:DUF1269 domain-containing protein [Streptomyces sp. AV19]|uniref:DUF1269 domain-containing protein n=1 Tax=Streptomyces sp. AV19 TaxID=2793068 RepID=UPI0018FED5D1|nr:DUF1269 domain-containing protein [Streptomyces sp. AV19]MBH1934165.1 DUF1269 domain-containing protein [Streptomyces sp. AV19]MDG4533572.1 DUF1269 domain-containing protein [Streptomyces sp. AV19]